MKNTITADYPKNTRGQVIVLFGIILIFIIGAVGVALDYGVIAMGATKIQHASDAAALAAANKYVSQINAGSTSAAAQTAAKTQAVTVAGQNTATIATSDVVFSGTFGNSADPLKVQVTASGTVDLLFGAVFKESQGITRHATALIEGGIPNAITGAAPLGMTVDQFNLSVGGGPITLSYNRIQSDDLDQYGEFIAMDYSGSGSAKSSAQWSDDLENLSTSQGDATIGEAAASLNVNGDNNGVKNKWEDGISPHVGSYITILLTDQTEANNGTYNPPVKGYAVVYVESYSRDPIELTISIPTNPPPGSYTVTDATGTVAPPGNLTAVPPATGGLIDDL